jgi:hypothetical protein
VVSHGVKDSAEVANDTQWHTHVVTLDSKNCVSKLNDDGTSSVNGMVKVAEITATKVESNDGGIGHG